MALTDFESIYLDQEDPWDVGDATDVRYGIAIDMIRKHGPYESIVELACGRGAFTNKLLEFTQKVIGYDISETAILKASKKYANVTFKQCDVSWEIWSKSADLVVHNDLLYYLVLRDVKKVMEDISKNSNRCFMMSCLGDSHLDFGEFEYYSNKYFIVKDVITDSSRVYAYMESKK